MNPTASTRLADKALAAELRQRLRGLTPAQAEMMRQAMRLHAAGDKLMSAQWMLQVAREAPDHPEVRLWQGLRHFEAGEWAAAAEHLSRVVTQRPDDFTAWCMLGVAQGRADDGGAAQHSLQQAARCATTPAQWLKLAVEADGLGLFDEALSAADALLALEPKSALGLLERVRCHKALGHTAAAAADCRALIAQGSGVAKAWFSLVDLKTVALSDAEREQLQQTALNPHWPAADRQLLDFALGKALEDAADPAGALAALQRANASVRAMQPWDAKAFARHAAALRDMALAGLPAQAAEQGSEVIFLTGLPRSGSTLFEQVLASHSQVEGASELPTLGLLIDAESRRRGRPFADWAPQATADEWTGLGQDYLRATARWRRHKPVSTDKLPDNWQWTIAIRAMLPQAHIIDCRRDPLETCWSCYKQLFAPGLANFSYDFDSLAQYWQACEALGDLVAERHPQFVRVQRYEALIDQPEAQIRELLAFCGLPFEVGCLNFQQAQRAIRTPSALQVRQPLTATSTPAAGYGALLDALRGTLEAAAE